MTQRMQEAYYNNKDGLKTDRLVAGRFVRP